MATTRTLRRWWSLYRCSPGIKTEAGFFGRTPVWCQNRDHPKALEQAHLAAGYVPTPGGYIGSKRRCPKGIGGKKCESSGKNCSLHNYCIAWDVEYNYNPHFRRRLTKRALWKLYRAGKTKYNPDIVASILKVKNTHGETLFRYLGYAIGDTMHWQLNVPPSRQTVDWTTVGDGVPPSQEVDDMFCKYRDGFGTQSGDEKVRHWQIKLNELRYDTGGVDGKYGTKTQGAVAIVAGGSGVQIGAVESAAIDIAVGGLHGSGSYTYGNPGG